jgi:hypothetical protein
MSAYEQTTKQNNKETYMSEHTHSHQVVPENPLKTPLSIVRNGVSSTLTVFEGKREPWKGRFYQAFQLTTDGTDTLSQDDTIFTNGLNWIGKSNLKNFINTILKRIGQDFVEDATPETGEDAGIFSLDKYTDFWTNLKSSAMKLSELQEAYQEEVEYYTRITSEFIAKMSDLSPEQIVQQKQLIDSTSTRIKSMKRDFDERKAKRSKEAAGETVAAVG